MEGIFLKLVNMSITAGWLIIAAVIIRAVLKNAPKSFRFILWALVAVRLVCPFSFESVLSLVPSSEPINTEIMFSKSPGIDSGIKAVDDVINPVIESKLSPDISESVNPMQVIVFAGTFIWICGMVIMLLYAFISYLRLRKKTAAFLWIDKNVRICDNISSPFILGVFKPVIYVPSFLNTTQLEYILAHERAHIKRRDYIWKPLGYMLLTVYWFNPLIWLSYILLCRDIELACDERVIKDMNITGRKEYSGVLLDCSIKRRTFMLCPLAFGEVGVKERIKSVLNYKKPAFWLIIIFAVLCVVVSLCLFTSPKKSVSDEPDKVVPEATLSADNNNYADDNNNSYADDNNNNYVDDNITNKPVETAPGDNGLMIGKTDFDFNDVKEFLSGLPNKVNKLVKKGCFVTAHGQLIGGRDVWDSFYANVKAHIPCDMVSVQFTVEGDAILDYVYYNGNTFYCVNDSSRDAFGGSDNGGYRELNYPYMNVYDEVLKNGDKTILIVLSEDEDMTYDEYYKAIASDKYIPDKLRYINTFNYGNINADITGNEVLENIKTAYDESKILIDEKKIAKITVTDAETGEVTSYSVLDSSNGFRNILKKYENLELEPVKEEVYRSGYRYKLMLYDADGEYIQSVIPYKDMVVIDGEIYGSTVHDTYIALLKALAGES